MQLGERWLTFFLPRVHSCCQLHADVSAQPLRGELCPRDKIQPSPSFPNSIDAALVLPLSTRFMLQSLPSLPVLLDLLTRREPSPLDSTTLDLLLQLIDRMFVSGITPPQVERPQATGLIAAMPAVQSNAAAAYSAAASSFLAESKWSGPARPAAPATLLSGSATPNYRLLDSTRSMLESLEVHWCTLLNQTDPISHSMLTTFSAQTPAQRRIVLYECIRALRVFLRQTSFASLSQSQSQTQSLRSVFTHALCQRLWEQWKQREADLQRWEQKSVEAATTGVRATEFLASTAPLMLLPDSYLWSVVQVLDSVANATVPNVAASAAPPSLFFPMFISLLDALIQHLSRYSGLYEQRRAETEAALDEFSAGSSLLARPIDFLFHFISLYPALLTQLAPLSRLQCFERSPATFEAELIVSISRISSQSHPLRPHLLTHLVDQEMRSLFGLSIESGPASSLTANPSPSAPSSSPPVPEFCSSISLLFRRAPTPSSSMPLPSPAPMPSPSLSFIPQPARRAHLASERLYAMAAGIVEKLLLRTNSEGKDDKQQLLSSARVCRHSHVRMGLACL